MTRVQPVIIELSFVDWESVTHGQLPPLLGFCAAHFVTTRNCHPLNLEGQLSQALSVSWASTHSSSGNSNKVRDASKHKTIAQEV